MLGDCAAFPVAWALVFDGRPPGWLPYREPHLTVEYLCARGWTEESRHQLLSTSYIKTPRTRAPFILVIGGPPACQTPAAYALVVPGTAWRSRTTSGH